MPTKFILFVALFIYSLSALSFDKNHLIEAGKVYEVAMGNFSEEQAMQYARIFSSDGSDKELAEIAATFYEVMHSDGFKSAYSEIIAETFTQEECKRLAMILNDPVLEKFRVSRPIYFKKVMSLAQEMLLSKLDNDGHQTP